ncbi:MAG: glycerophosphodiester phosphodiesterase [Roseburia sp.]|nr:glycerophosphodiester phosphodiesterase [Roseburia sp.]
MLHMMIFVCVLCVAAVVCGYLLLIMPHVSSKNKTKVFQRWLYAHRGLHDNRGEAPENSMRAFAKAVEAGFGIELDIQLTKDKIPVVFHDFTLDRACGGKGRIADYTCEELRQFTLFGSQERIPRFEEVLGLVNGRVPLIVELKIEYKDMSLCREADRLLCDYRGLYCIESFNPLAVLWYRRRRSGVVRGQLSDAFCREKKSCHIVRFVLQNLLLNCLTKPDFIAYNHKYSKQLSRKLCRKLYHNTAAAWTIKSQAELEAARKDFDIFIFDSFMPPAAAS